MEEEATFLGIDLEVWNNMPVMKQIEAIEKSTGNTDATMKLILEELQKEEVLPEVLPEVKEEVVEEIVIPSETAEPSSELPAEEKEEPAAETQKALTVDEPVKEEATEEVPVVEEVVEEVPVEETEEPIDYMKLIYEELQTQHEIDAQNQLALVQQLDVLEEQGIKANEVDDMAGLYLMYLLPLVAVVTIGNKVLNPFLRG